MVELEECNALKLAHASLAERLKPGDTCVDATAGRGRDTLFLCGLVGETGKIYAFDIQEEALRSTRERLEGAGVLGRAELIHDSHEHMEQYVKEPVDAVVFNFGYLPGGNHNLYTKKESSIAAIEAALRLVKPGGLVSLCIYYGGDSGFEEKDALMVYLKTIDFKQFTVLLHDFYNRPNCPPLCVDIEKHGGTR